jgi:predicted transcriptional regulator
VAKPLRFKDFQTVDYTPGMDDQISKNAKDRKQDEALDFSQRRARSRLMKKIKAKLKLGRAKAARKTASIDILKKRTLKQVRNVLFLKFSKGKTRDEIPAARRKEIEDRIDKIPKERLKNLSMKLLPKVRKQEMERKRKKAESGAK